MDMDGMDMNMGSGTAPTMTMYLHFVPFTDAIWFKDWTPATPGALFGACIGLFVLAIVERWVAGMSGVLDGYLRRKSEAEADRWKAAHNSLPKLPVLSSKSQPELALFETPQSIPQTIKISSIRKLALPFSLPRELSRATLKTLQAFIAYAVMLAVMTFNAAFIISVLIGSFVGELLFGRFSSGHGHHT